MDLPTITAAIWVAEHIAHLDAIVAGYFNPGHYAKLRLKPEVQSYKAAAVYIKMAAK